MEMMEKLIMLYLKPANLEDAKQEYAFIKSMPEEENGVINKWWNASYEEFKTIGIPEMIHSSQGIDLKEGYVPETFLFLWDDEKIVGQFRIRHYLCEKLRNGGGHISYFIRKEYRGHGYATEGLRLTLDLAGTIIPEDEIYLRVSKKNPASLHAMLHNGGYIHHEDDLKYYVRIHK